MYNKNNYIIIAYSPLKVIHDIKKGSYYAKAMKQEGYMNRRGVCDPLIGTELWRELRVY